MRLIASLLLIGLVMSAGAAGYSTVRGTWWSLGLAVLSTAGFWLAVWQVHSWCNTGGNQDLAQDSEDPDVIFLNYRSDPQEARPRPDRRAG